MARERYLLDVGEDTIHSNVIVLKTKKEKWQNFWHYYKWIILGSVIAAGVVFSMIWSIATKPKPDYQIALMTQYEYPEEVVTQLETKLAEYADDRNGNGEVLAQINCYQYLTGESAQDQDPNYVTAGSVKFMADVSSGDSMIFLTDEQSFKNVMEAGRIFAYTDDFSTPNDTAEDYDRMRYAWKECKLLSPIDITYEVEGVEHETVVERLLGTLSVSLRACDGTAIANDADKVAEFESAKKLFLKLVNGE